MLAAAGILPPTACICRRRPLVAARMSPVTRSSARPAEGHMSSASDVPCRVPVPAALRVTPPASVPAVFRRHSPDWHAATSRTALRSCERPSKYQLATSPFRPMSNCTGNRPSLSVLGTAHTTFAPATLLQPCNVKTFSHNIGRVIQGEVGSHPASALPRTHCRAAAQFGISDAFPGPRPGTAVGAA